MKRLTAAILSVGLLAGGPALANGDEHDHAHGHGDQQVQHYKSKPAPNLKAAVENLREYNRKLEQHLDQEMTVENMEQIHQLSYTLEKALKRMDKDLANIASVLEGMHLASEARNQDKVEGNAETYLENMNMILGES